MVVGSRWHKNCRKRSESENRRVERALEAVALGLIRETAVQIPPSGRAWLRPLPASVAFRSRFYEFPTNVPVCPLVGGSNCCCARSFGRLAASGQKRGKRTTTRKTRRRWISRQTRRATRASSAVDTQSGVRSPWTKTAVRPASIPTTRTVGAASRTSTTD